jgi:hypothetical protein
MCMTKLAVASCTGYSTQCATTCSSTHLAFLRLHHGMVRRTGRKHTTSGTLLLACLANEHHTPRWTGRPTTLASPRGREAEPQRGGRGGSHWPPPTLGPSMSGSQKPPSSEFRLQLLLAIPPSSSPIPTSAPRHQPPHAGGAMPKKMGVNSKAEAARERRVD